MTREDIIRMARKVGGVDLQSHGWTTWVGTQSTEFLERFAALVASAERPWVGLTDDEVGNLSDFAYANDEEFVRNVEKHLKEKNSG